MKDKRLIKYSVIAFFWLFILILFITIFNKTNVLYSMDNSFEEFNNELVEEGRVFIQEIQIDKNNFSKLKIYFNSDNMNQKQSIKIKLIDVQSKKKIYQNTINNQDIIGNGYYTLSFDKIAKSQKKRYRLTLEYEKNSKKRILPIIVKGEDLLSIDSEETLNHMAYTTYNFSQNRLYVSIGLFSLLFILLNGALYIILKNNITIEKKYLILSLIIYTFFLFLMPMFTGHDEFYHWFRSYEVSEGNMVSEIHNQKAESLLPLGVNAIMNTSYDKIKYQNMHDVLGVKINKEDKGYHDMSTVAVYSPVQYFPQALGIKLASIFTDYSLILAYAARFMNMLFSIFMIYTAIKIIPIGKKMLFTLAFFPILIEGFVTLSPDGITNCSCILFIAYILKLLKEKDINNKNIAFLMLLGVIIGLCKIVYIPLVFIALLLPKNKFKDKKHYWISIGAILFISIASNIIWLGISSRYLSLYHDGATQVQTKFVLTHMFQYLQIFLETLFSQFDYYLMTMIGRDLGWGGLVVVYPIIIYLILTLFILSILDEKKRIKELEQYKNIIILLVICLLIIGLIFTSLFVQWTRPHVFEIKGVQGRYFLPILPLIGILLSRFKFLTTKKFNFNVVAPIVIAISYFVIFIQMFTIFI